MRPAVSALILCFTYLLCASGYIDATDAEASLDTAKVFWKSGTLRISPGPPNTYFEALAHDTMARRIFYAHNAQGEWYTKMGLIMPLLYLPCVAVAETFTKLFPSRSTDLLTRFLASGVNSIVLTILVLFLATFFSGVLQSRPAGWSFALITGFGTYLFAYSKMAHREPIQALFLSGAFLFLFSHPVWRPRPLFAGICVGGGLLTKLAFGIFVIPLIPLVLAICRQKRSARPLLAFSVPILAAGLVWLLYARHAWGSPWQTGYSPAVQMFHPSVWKTDFWEGLSTQLFSYNSSFFLWNPIFLLALPAYLFFRTTTVTLYEICVLTAFFLQAAFYARWHSPLGHESLGPRYLVPLAPVLMTLFIFIDWRGLLKKKWARIMAPLVVILCIGMQGIHVLVKPQQYWTLVGNAPEVRKVPHWQANWVLLKKKLAGKKEIYTQADFNRRSAFLVDLTPYETLQGFNFWSAHAYRYFTASENGGVIGTRSVPVPSLPSRSAPLPYHH